MFKGVSKEPCEGQSKGLLYDGSISPLRDLHPFFELFFHIEKQYGKTCMYYIKYDIILMVVGTTLMALCYDPINITTVCTRITLQVYEISFAMLLGVFESRRK